MIDDVTHGTRATRARTRVNTALINTSLASGTLGVHRTFGTTTSVWVTLVVLEAATHAGDTLGVGATDGTGVLGRCRLGLYCNKIDNIKYDLWQKSVLIIM